MSSKDFLDEYNDDDMDVVSARRAAKNKVLASKQREAQLQAAKGAAAARKEVHTLSKESASFNDKKATQLDMFAVSSSETYPFLNALIPVVLKCFDRGRVLTLKEILAQKPHPVRKAPEYLAEGAMPDERVRTLWDGMGETRSGLLPPYDAVDGPSRAFIARLMLFSNGPRDSTVRDMVAATKYTSMVKSTTQTPDTGAYREEPSVHPVGHGLTVGYTVRHVRPFMVWASRLAPAAADLAFLHEPLFESIFSVSSPRVRGDGDLVYQTGLCPVRAPLLWVVATKAGRIANLMVKLDTSVNQVCVAGSMAFMRSVPKAGAAASNVWVPNGFLARRSVDFIHKGYVAQALAALPPASQLRFVEEAVAAAEEIGYGGEHNVEPPLNFEDTARAFYPLAFCPRGLPEEERIAGMVSRLAFLRTDFFDPKISISPEAFSRVLNAVTGASHGAKARAKAAVKTFAFAAEARAGGVNRFDRGDTFGDRALRGRVRHAPLYDSDDDVYPQSGEVTEAEAFSNIADALAGCAEVRIGVLAWLYSRCKSAVQAVEDSRFSWLFVCLRPLIDGAHMAFGAFCEAMRGAVAWVRGGGTEAPDAGYAAVAVGDVVVTYRGTRAGAVLGALLGSVVVATPEDVASVPAGFTATAVGTDLRLPSLLVGGTEPQMMFDARSVVAVGALLHAAERILKVVQALATVVFKQLGFSTGDEAAAAEVEACHDAVSAALAASKLVPSIELRELRVRSLLALRGAWRARVVGHASTQALVRELGSLEQLIKDACTSESASTLRVEPVVGAFRGAPGVGKDQAVGLLADPRPETCLQWWDGAGWRPVGAFWYRNPVDAFMSGFRGQKVVVYSDFAQVKKEPERTAAVNELIMGASTAPWLVSGADVSAKGQEFAPEYIFLTTNTVGRDVAANIESTDAAARRITADFTVLRGEVYVLTYLAANVGDMSHVGVDRALLPLERMERSPDGQPRGIRMTLSEVQRLLEACNRRKHEYHTGITTAPRARLPHPDATPAAQGLQGALLALLLAASSACTAMVCCDPQQPVHVRAGCGVTAAATGYFAARTAFRAYQTAVDSYEVLEAAATSALHALTSVQHMKMRAGQVLDSVLDGLRAVWTYFWECTPTCFARVAAWACDHWVSLSALYGLYKSGAFSWLTEKLFGSASAQAKPVYFYSDGDKQRTMVIPRKPAQFVFNRVRAPAPQALVLEGEPGPRLHDVASSTVLLDVSVTGAPTSSVHALCVGPMQFITVSHVFAGVGDNRGAAGLARAGSVTMHTAAGTEVRDLGDIELVRSSGPYNDLVGFTFPGMAASPRSCRDRFSAEPYAGNTPLTMVGPCVGGREEIVSSRVSTLRADLRYGLDDSRARTTDGPYEYHAEYGIRSEMATRSGDCGKALVTPDGRVVGIHAAGSVSMGLGYALPLEDSVIAPLVAALTGAAAPAEPVQPQSGSVRSPGHPAWRLAEYLPAGRSASWRTHSVLTGTSFTEGVATREAQVAVLRHCGAEARLKVPSFDNQRTLGITRAEQLIVPRVPTRFYADQDAAFMAECLRIKYRALRSGAPPYQRWTIMQAMAAAPKNTASGFPYQFKDGMGPDSHPRPMKGDLLKEVAPGVFSMHDRLRDEYTRLQQALLAYEPASSYHIVNKASVKDELLKPGKKPRLIHVVGLHFLLRMYEAFGAFFGAMIAAHDRIECRRSIGINPYSNSWDRLCRATEGGFSTDMSNCDMNVTVEDLDVVAGVWAEQCEDPDAASLVRMLGRAHCLLDNTVHEFYGSHPSGHVGTVQVNDDVVDMHACAAWRDVRLARGLPCDPASVQASFRISTYGDDAKHKPLEPFMDSCIDEFMGRFSSRGQVATTASKRAFRPGEARTPEDEEFIKRTPVLLDGDAVRLYVPDFSGRDVYIAPLSSLSIISSAAWRRKGDVSGLYYSQRAQSCLMEAALHGPDLYADVLAIVRLNLAAYNPGAVMVNESGAEVEPPAYDAMRAEMLRRATSAPCATDALYWATPAAVADRGLTCQCRTWLRDLTREGVEPNPGPAWAGLALLVACFGILPFGAAFAGVYALATRARWPRKYAAMLAWEQSKRAFVQIMPLWALWACCIVAFWFQRRARMVGKFANAARTGYLFFAACFVHAATAVEQSSLLMGYFRQWTDNADPAVYFTEHGPAFEKRREQARRRRAQQELRAAGLLE